MQEASTFPSRDELWALAGSTNLADRAFAASVLQLRRPALPSAVVDEVYARIQATARQAHTELRARIAAQQDSRPTFLRELEALPLELRDHWVEEVLGIAYPPLALSKLPAGSVSYSPSGWAEVQFLLQHADLGANETLVDLGSGLGKVVLLAALLTRAQAVGIELDSTLLKAARLAATELALERARFLEADVAEGPLPEADVYYMFIPLQRSLPVLQSLAPIARRRKVTLFAQGLDLTLAPWLRRTGNACYWLEQFESQ